MRQKAFTKEYAEELEFNIESNLAKYGSDSFDYNAKAVVDLPYEAHKGLLEEMMPFLSTEAKVEVDAAIKLYEAYKDLTPLEASYRPFWLYLSHVELYPYMHKRWLEGEDMEGEALAGHIDSHFFYKHQVLRSHLEGMYWLVRKSVEYDDNGIPDYTYTRFLFSRRVLGDRGIAARKFLFANDRLFKGILKYIMKNENTIFSHHMQARATYCAKLLNAKGAVVEMSMWTEKDVEVFLDMNKATIQLQNND